MSGDPAGYDAWRTETGPYPTTRREDRPPVRRHSVDHPARWTRCGRCRLLERIRGGGMADVHCACDRRPNRAVAVKVIAILDAGHRRREYIVMELVDDADLYSVAAVAYRLLGGRAPAPARALSEARPDLPSSLTRAVEQALARDPAARQESAMRFRAQPMAPWSGSLRRVLRAAGRT